jgi:hypothetical protein
MLTILRLSTRFEEALPLVCANITLPFGIAPEGGPNRPIEVVWKFDLSPELGTKGCK